MEILGNLLYGFSVALTPECLIYAFIGVVVGNAVGVLPGLGPPTAIALLLPITIGMNPAAALIMFAGIYYGAMYGGTITSVLINTPGEAASVATTFDGYQMARQGRAGAALGIAAFGSFIAGTLSVIGLMLLAQPLITFALSFSAAEYAMVMVLALTTLGGLVGDSALKSIMMAIVGLILSTVGIEPISAISRFTFGSKELFDGIGIIPVTMGLFGLAEVLCNVDEFVEQQVFSSRVGSLLPTMKDWALCKWSILRGSIIGFIVGIVPGAGATLSSFVAYAVEKKSSKYPEKFGTGMIEGVAAPESANNAATAGAMVPMLTLGIPASATTAIMVAALIMYGIRPGPLLFEQHPDIAWGLIASMYIGNAMLLLLNVPLIGIWTRMLYIPYNLLTVLIALFVFTGAYANNGLMTEVWLAVGFGFAGYFMRKLDLPAAPVVLGLVLGQMLEEHTRRALIFSNGDWTTFATRPISGFLLAVTVGLLVYRAVQAIRAWRRGEPPKQSLGNAEII